MRQCGFRAVDINLIRQCGPYIEDDDEIILLTRADTARVIAECKREI